MDHIVGAIKRVISEPDNINIEKSSDAHVEQEIEDAIFLAPPQTSLQQDNNNGPPTVVEMDGDQMQVDNATVIQIDEGSGTSTSSSLSDGNHDQQLLMRPQQPSSLPQQQQQQQHHYNQPAPRMHRNDSRISADSQSIGGSSSVSTNRNGSGNWGWFEDVHDSRMNKRAKGNRADGQPHLQSSQTDDSHDGAAVMAVTAPTYVLEESLSSQKLWKHTAGNRPPQPVEERAFYEKMWAQNFAKSKVHYGMPAEVLTATSPISLSPFADGNFHTELSNYDLADESKLATGKTTEEAALLDRLNVQHQDSSTGSESNKILQHTLVNKRVKGMGSEDSLNVLVRGNNVFGTTVSKSFAKTGGNGGSLEGVDTINISVASYRVVDSKKHGKYAQYLVIYREGSIRDTIGVWKRYSDFEDLSHKVSQTHESCASVLANMSPLAVTEEPEVEHLPNAITSWRLLKKRQRWYRCLEPGYLSLKVFLLERFLHDILFESSSPGLLREFVEADVTAAQASQAA